MSLCSKLSLKYMLSTMLTTILVLLFLYFFSYLRTSTCGVAQGNIHTWYELYPTYPVVIIFHVVSMVVMG